MPVRQTSAVERPVPLESLEVAEDRRRYRRSVWLALAALGGLLVLQALALAPARRLAVRPPAWDQANHLEVAARYRDLARAGRWSEVWTYTPNSSIPPFPPLYHLALAAVSGAAQPAAAVWVNWLYLALLVVSVFGATLELRRDAWCAAAAAAAFAGAPVVQELLRTPLVDLPLTAVAAFGYWTLLRCDGFTRWKASYLFGLACAAGMLHKWSFFSYMLPAAIVWARALRRPESRRHAVVAALLGVGLAAPWYLIRLPLVLIRLTQATNDFVVPFWRGAASLRYLQLMPSQLGFAFSIVAGLGAILAARSASRRARPLAACVACAYVFWALLPNRQFRYLLPALPAAAALAGGTVAPPVLWALAAWQAAGAGRLWLSECGERPAEWPVAAIVKEIARQPRAASVVPVAVIANHESLNKLGLVWYAHRLGASALQFRGVKDVPWELSPYVVFKTGSLGPDSVTADFRDAAAEIERAGGWFSRGFEPAARWPLQDGSQAVLYSARRMVSRPFAGQHLRTRLGFSSLIDVPEASVRLEGWDPARGVYRRVEMDAPEVFLEGLRVSGVRVELSDALLVPDGDGARLLRASRLRVVSASVEAAAVRERLRRAGVETEAIELDGTAAVAARFHGLPVFMELETRSDGREELCGVRMKAARIAGLPLPPAWIERYALNGPVFELRSSADATAVASVFGLHRSWPIPTEMTGCSVEGGRVTLR